MSLPATLYADMRKLYSPGAKRLREKWGIGSSGAKLTITECERLYALAGGQLKAEVDIELSHTRNAESAIAFHQESRKRRAKARRKGK